jgi:hypothetical protein
VVVRSLPTSTAICGEGMRYAFPEVGCVAKAATALAVDPLARHHRPYTGSAVGGMFTVHGTSLASVAACCGQACACDAGAAPTYVANRRFCFGPVRWNQNLRRKAGIGPSHGGNGRALRLARPIIDARFSRYGRDGFWGRPWSRRLSCRRLGGLLQTIDPIALASGAPPPGSDGGLDRRESVRQKDRTASRFLDFYRR